MTDRPTPEQIAGLCIGGLPQCDKWTRAHGLVTSAIEAERAKACLRVAEERAAVVRWLQQRVHTTACEVQNLLDIADDIERGEHRK